MPTRNNVASSKLVMYFLSSELFSIAALIHEIPQSIAPDAIKLRFNGLPTPRYVVSYDTSECPERTT
jgi:hypothetical protein